MKRMLSAGLLFLLLTVIAAGKIALQPTGYLNDFAGFLKEDGRSRLENLLREVEKKTSAEIAVVTIESLEGENLEEFANELFNQWGVGKKGKDNGVLILVAQKERKIRIEVGYGLEAVLTDGKCGQIIRTVLTPAFRKQEFGEGLYQAVTIISRIIRGEEVKLPAGGSPSDKAPIGFVLFWVGFCLFFTFAALGVIGLLIQVVYLLGLGTFTLAASKSTGGAQNPLGDNGAILVMLVPFIIAFLSPIGAGIVGPLRKKHLKRRFKNDWKDHWYWWYGFPPTGSGTGGSRGGWGGGFGGGGGGFGGGSSGGGGASGGW